MTVRTWPGMAGGLLTLLLCGCQSANWFAHQRDQQEPPQSSRLADRRDDSRPEPGKASGKSSQETGTKIARTGTDAGSNSSLSKTAAEWYTEGARLENDRKFSEARVAYEHAVDVDPGFAEAHHRLGVIADRASEFALADRHYNKAHELKPSDPAILSDMGYSQYLRKNDKEAERRLKEALELEPLHGDANGNLAQVYVRQRRYDEAFAALQKIESPEGARAKLASMLPQGAPSVDEIAQRAAPGPGSTREPIQKVADSRSMSDDQARWLEEQTSAVASPPAGSNVIHADGTTALLDASPVEKPAPAGRRDLPTIAPLAATGAPPADSGRPAAAPLAPPLVAESGAPTRNAPPGSGGFWQGTPLPAVEPGPPGMAQTPVSPPGGTPADPSVPRVTITDVTPRSDISLTGGTAPAAPTNQNSASRLAALAGLNAGPGSLFPTGVTAVAGPVAANPQLLGAASPWGSQKPVATAGRDLPAWPGVEEQPASGVVQAGGTLADWPAASIPPAGTQPRQADPLAAFQHEIDQQAAIEDAKALPAWPGPPAQPPAAGAHPPVGAGGNLSPWPALSTGMKAETPGASPLAAQMDAGPLPRPGAAQPWPPRPQTLQKPIAPTQQPTSTQPAPTVAWPAPQTAAPLPAWPSGNAQ